MRAVLKVQNSMVFKKLISLQGDPICLNHRLPLWKPLFSLSKNLFRIFLIGLLGKQLFTDGALIVRKNISLSSLAAGITQLWDG